MTYFVLGRQRKGFNRSWKTWTLNTLFWFFLLTSCKRIAHGRSPVFNSGQVAVNGIGAVIPRKQGAAEILGLRLCEVAGHSLVPGTPPDISLKGAENTTSCMWGHRILFYQREFCQDVLRLMIRKQIIFFILSSKKSKIPGDTPRKCGTSSHQFLDTTRCSHSDPIRLQSLKKAAL